VDEQRFEELSGDVTVERSVVLSAAPETVWDHLSDGELLSGWMDGDVTIDARRGGSIRMARPGAPDVWGGVEDVVPGRRLQWCWRTDDGLPTMVEIEVEPAGEGSRVTVRETLLPWQVTEAPPRWMPGGSLEARVGTLLAA
jgi:uncharacterized protein YndB with AHSA1/START domain